MKTLIYELRAGRYELAKLCDNGGDELKFLFELPIDAAIKIADKTYKVTKGKLTVKICELGEGEIHPKLYTGADVETLCGFTIKGSAILPLPHDDEYVRRIGGICETLSRRITTLEAEISEMKKRISAPLEF